MSNPAHDFKGEVSRKKKSGGDYDGWILRLLEKPEDIEFSFSLQDWLEFAADKLGTLSRGQISVLAERRDLVFKW